jgi:hypothetical protein
MNRKQPGLKRMTRCIVPLTGAFVILIALAAILQSGENVQAARSQEVAAGRLPTDPTTDLFLSAVAHGTAGQLAQSLAVGDLNADGKLDVVVANCCGGPSGHGSIGVLLGNGDGTFQPAAEYDSQGGSLSIAIGDLNHDGKPDLVVANVGCVSTSAPACVGVLLGKGDGTFQPVVTYDAGENGAYSGEGIFVPLVLADVNGDGKLDVILANQTSSANNYEGSAVVLLGNGDGTLQAAKFLDSGGGFASSVAVADLNHDGKVDLVVVNCAPSGATGCNHTVPGPVAVLLGNGDGTFQPAKTYSRGKGGGSISDPVVIADVNGDGKPDLLVGTLCVIIKSGACSGHGYVGVLIGTGDGTFKPAVNYDSGGGSASSIVLADVDGDGKLDVVVANGFAGVLRGNGDGTFRLPDTYFTDGAAGLVLVADLNGDGKLDLIASDVTSNQIAVFMGNGSGFAGPMIFPSGGFVLSQIAVSDVNHDGRPDVLAANWCPNEVNCVEGQAEQGTLGVLINNNAFVYNGTTTGLTSNLDPASPNQLITYTATVTSPGGGPVTGTVVFTDHGNVIAEVNLANNQATFSRQYASTGTHLIACRYEGDSANGGSISLALPEYIKILPVASKTVLVTSGSPSQLGQSVTFTATVTSNFGSIPNGELVTFFDGSATLGSVPLSGGKAAFTTSSLSATRHTIKAVYSGDSSFKTSARSVSQVVEP